MAFWHTKQIEEFNNKKHDHEKIKNSLGSRIKYFIYCKHNIAVYNQLKKLENKRFCEGGKFIAQEIFLN